MSGQGYIDRLVPGCRINKITPKQRQDFTMFWKHTVNYVEKQDQKNSSEQFPTDACPYRYFKITFIFDFMVGHEHVTDTH